MTRSRRNPAWLLALLFGGLLLVASCGGDDDDSVAPTATSSTGPTATVGDAPTGCPEVPYAVALRAAENESVGSESDAFEVTSAKAVKLAGGAAYTIYLADFPIDEGEISAFSAPSAPAGGTLVTLFLTTFNASEDPDMVEPGISIKYTPDFGVLTFRVVTQVGPKQYGSQQMAEGTVTVDEAGDAICGSVDYVDSAGDDIGDVQNRLQGTFSAPVVAEY